MHEIRLAKESDSEQILRIYAPFCSEDSAVSFEIVAPSIAEMKARVRGTLEKLPWLVYEDGDHIMGYAYAGPHKARAAYRWSVDTSIFVSQEARRKGVARTLYNALFSILRLQGYVNAFAGITQPNPGSIGLHEAMGFTKNALYEHVGFKCGAWHDVAFYSLALTPLPAHPAEPTNINMLLETPEFNKLLASSTDRCSLSAK